MRLCVFVCLFVCLFVSETVFLHFPSAMVGYFVPVPGLCFCSAVCLLIAKVMTSVLTYELLY